MATTSVRLTQLSPGAGCACKLPASELDYKRAYAAVAIAAGLTPQQAVRVYGFESGGNGNFDVQAGLEHPSPTAHAISTALGVMLVMTGGFGLT